MKLSTTLPLVLFPALTFAHAEGIHPAHRRHSARSGSGGYGKRAPALLDDLTGLLIGDSGSTSHAASSTSTTSSAGASSSSVHSSVASTSAAATTTSQNEETSTSAASSLPSTSSTSSTSTSTTTTAVSSSTAGPSVNESSTVSSSSSTSTTSSSSSTVQSLSPSIASTTSSTATESNVLSSASGSVHYTTNAAGQTQLVTVVLTQSAVDATAHAATASATSTSAAKESKFPTGGIIGICVGVGAAILALIALAVWRMKRRGRDEDEAIRWPELNRHGDSDAHHALPARETGQHGFETNPLQRSLSSSSELQYADYPIASHPDYDLPQHSPVPMALNGSSFGASSSLEDDYALSEKYPPTSPHAPSHDDHDNYTSLPPPVQPQASVGLGMGGAMFGHTTTPEMEEDPYGGVQMTQLSHGVTYQDMTSPEYSHQPMPNLHDYRFE
ncbi:Hypothetical protein CGB_G3320C [Cryptococcus gattii WM276]|uniref:Mid2 domain-containing protein n=1 Tax=Cryptococcus gattii serotype B (strain WM276 / ATCC MYA-4071) TaxID=367775 RepID=E6R9F8_CRYGW|nr:Hypothetical protein CGB_G3320C [Cryptococcus gattii WM276]ADV23477.1 Hypothetical protein CGB_G3320C [Cryptococcus gattii WM276]